MVVTKLLSPRFYALKHICSKLELLSSVLIVCVLMVWGNMRGEAEDKKDANCSRGAGVNCWRVER